MTGGPIRALPAATVARLDREVATHQADWRSAGLATTDAHVDRLLAAVASLAADGPAWTYALAPETGWTPVRDAREIVPPLPW